MKLIISMLVSLIPTLGLAQSQSASFDASYAAKLRAAIRANTVFGQSFTGNPRAEFTVSLSAACEVLQVRLKSSSGNKSWDEAAERAINRTTPFPKPPSGSCPGSMLISHQPRDGSKEGMM
ncbi:MAG: TonB C-terminal domain-containing protein [Betaproteobacteria bacterium]|nr:TonB C-terminal domain-containing protein [Betaproteobacteria bacterium]